MSIVIILLVLTYFCLNPKVDKYTDYRNIKHIVIWYNWFNKRKYFHYQKVA